MKDPIGLIVTVKREKTTSRGRVGGELWGGGAVFLQVQPGDLNPVCCKYRVARLAGPESSLGHDSLLGPARGSV